MIERLTHMLQRSENAVFFGGAGVSTESGIPDFRSEGGVFAAIETYGRPPEELLSRAFFREDPDTFFRYHKRHIVHTEARPNAAHRALAQLERRGTLKAVVTQNIDGLHQAAGSKVVHELHGSIARNYCVDCGARYTLEYTLDEANCRGETPLCAKCGGIVRPDVVLYGEGLDDATVRAALAAISAADTLIVGGTSLVVYPAAGFLNYFEGDNLVLINKSPTAFDERAQLVIHDAIGEVLSRAVAGLDQRGAMG